jgi:hypothetical protein
MFSPGPGHANYTCVTVHDLAPTWSFNPLLGFQAFWVHFPEPKSKVSR